MKPTGMNSVKRIIDRHSVEKFPLKTKCFVEKYNIVFAWPVAVVEYHLKVFIYFNNQIVLSLHLDSLRWDLLNNFMRSFIVFQILGKVPNDREMASMWFYLFMRIQARSERSSICCQCLLKIQCVLRKRRYFVPMQAVAQGVQLLIFNDDSFIPRQTLLFSATLPKLLVEFTKAGIYVMCM